MPLRFALIANPGSERALGFMAACRSRGLPEPLLFPWEELLFWAANFQEWLGKADALRIETPAGNPAVERLLLAHGAADLAACEPEYPSLDAEECLELPPDDGELRNQRQWYLGLRSVLNEFGAYCDSSGLPAMNHPAGIIRMFDKEATRNLLMEAGVPVAASAGICLNFEHLVSLMDLHGWDRIFLKPCHGSSASGVMAISRGPRGPWQAFTSAKLEGLRIRNSKNPLRLTDPADIRMTVDAVCQQRALVERWFPKMSIGGRTCDFRILVIAGRARHVAVRTSTTPITNLHLRNRRGELQEVIDKIGTAAWEEALATAEAAAACFPDCHYCGVDLMIGARGHRSVVAELNAFGDHLHRERWEGMNPWEAELALWPTTAQSRPAV
jgi:hypothetical protein